LSFIVILTSKDSKWPKVKQPFSVKAAEPNTQNGKDNVTCKEWNTIAEEIIQNKKSGMEKRINDNK
jgi:hypothetical protein